MRDPSNHTVRRTVSVAEAREAFGELVRRYHGATTAYAYALLRIRGAKMPPRRRF